MIVRNIIVDRKICDEAIYRL